jgi:hypothetical protein
MVDSTSSTCKRDISEHEANQEAEPELELESKSETEPDLEPEPQSESYNDVEQTGADESVPWFCSSSRLDDDTMKVATGEESARQSCSSSRPDDDTQLPDPFL